MSLGDINQPETSSRSMFVLKQSADIYTAMMILAFVFIVIGCLFLLLELKAYDLSIHVPADAKVPQALWLPQQPTIALHQPHTEFFAFNSPGSFAAIASPMLASSC